MEGDETLTVCVNAYKLLLMRSLLGRCLSRNTSSFKTAHCPRSSGVHLNRPSWMSLSVIDPWGTEMSRTTESAFLPITDAIALQKQNQSAHHSLNSSATDTTLQTPAAFTCIYFFYNKVYLYMLIQCIHIKLWLNNTYNYYSLCTAFKSLWLIRFFKDKKKKKSQQGCI